MGIVYIKVGKGILLVNIFVIYCCVTNYFQNLAVEGNKYFISVPVGRELGLSLTGSFGSGPLKPTVKVITRAAVTSRSD